MKKGIVANHEDLSVGGGGWGMRIPITLNPLLIPLLSLHFYMLTQKWCDSMTIHISIYLNLRKMFAARKGWEGVRVQLLMLRAWK